MNKESILKITENYVKTNFNQESTGHDWWHIKRVHDLSLQINEIEKKDEFIVGMIALLHDVFDEKFSDGNVKQKGDTYHTSRKGGHGIGLSSIAITAERYGGVAKFSHNGTKFYTDIVLRQ